MSFATLPCLLSSLVLGPSEPPVPDSTGSEEAPAPSALEALVSRLKVEGGADVYSGYNFNRPADGANFIPGWQTIGENNRGKALGTQVAYAGERLSAAFNTFIGEEGSGGSAGLRLFADVVATYQVTDALGLAATADVGTQRRPGRQAALWYGAGLNARVQVARPVAVAARAEFYDDRDGLISGTAQRLVEGTVTLEVRPAEHLVLKLEARHDRSTTDVFGGSETAAEGTPVPRSTQTLVVAGATAYF